MIISGRIDKDYDGFAKIGNESFVDIMYDFAKDKGVTYYHNNGLGGRKAIIPNCSVSMYFSKREMDFEEAQKKFLDTMFGASGVFEMEENNVGYSEWTIVGYDLEECQLGGHNLNDILLSHKGEYVNIKVEISKYGHNYMGW